jgi:hypothetical protein
MEGIDRGAVPALKRMIGEDLDERTAVVQPCDLPHHLFEGELGIIIIFIQRMQTCWPARDIIGLRSNRKIQQCFHRWWSVCTYSPSRVKTVTDKLPFYLLSDAELPAPTHLTVILAKVGDSARRGYNLNCIDSLMDLPNSHTHTLRSPRSISRPISRPISRRGFGSAALILTLVGIVIFLVGALISLRALGGLYQSTAADPLGNQNQNVSENSSDPGTVQREMFKGALVCALGVPFIVAGKVVGAVSKRRRRGV